MTTTAELDQILAGWSPAGRATLRQIFNEAPAARRLGWLGYRRWWCRSVWAIGRAAWAEVKS